MQEAISKYLSKHGFEAFKPKAVLFDMDGVLYNSMPNHACAWQQAMAQFDITMTAHDAYATEGARGIDTIRMMVKAQQGHEISLEEAQKMYDVKTHLFHEMPEARIFYGVKSLMRKIRQCGMTIGVVTGSGQRPLLNRLLNDFGEFLNENHIVTAYDVKRGKPYPDPYLMGMQKVATPSMGDHRGRECTFGRTGSYGSEVFHHCRQHGSAARPFAHRCRCRPAAAKSLPSLPPVGLLLPVYSLNS